MSTINPNTTGNHTVIDQSNIDIIAVAVSVALETKCAVNACQRIQRFLFIDFMVGAV